MVMIAFPSFSREFEPGPKPRIAAVGGKRTFGRTSLILGIIPLGLFIIMVIIGFCIGNVETAGICLNVPAGCWIAAAPLVSLFAMMYGLFSIIDTIRFGPDIKDIFFGLAGMMLGILDIVLVLFVLASISNPE